MLYLLLLFVMEHYIISIILSEFMFMNGCINRFSDAEFIIFVWRVFLYLNINIERMFVLRNFELYNVEIFFQKRDTKYRDYLAS